MTSSSNVHRSRHFVSRSHRKYFINRAILEALESRVLLTVTHTLTWTGATNNDLFNQNNWNDDQNSGNPPLVAINDTANDIFDLVFNGTATPTGPVVVNQNNKSVHSLTLTNDHFALDLQNFNFTVNTYVKLGLSFSSGWLTIQSGSTPGNPATFAAASLLVATSANSTGELDITGTNTNVIYHNLSVATSTSAVGTLDISSSATLDAELTSDPINLGGAGIAIVSFHSGATVFTRGAIVGGHGTANGGTTTVDTGTINSSSGNYKFPMIQLKPSMLMAA